MARPGSRRHLTRCAGPALLVLGSLLTSLGGCDAAAPPVGDDEPSDSNTAVSGLPDTVGPGLAPDPSFGPPEGPDGDEPSASAPEFVDRLIEELELGNIAFGVPDSMRYARPEIIQLLLSPSLTAPELEDRLEAPGEAVKAIARIGNRMEAILTGSKFQIQPLTPDLQAVGASQATIWLWEVTPVETGQGVLRLTLSAYIDVSGRDTPFVIRTFDRSVQVHISAAHRIARFVGKNWQWLWAAVLVPIAGYFWRRRVKSADEGPNE